MENQSNTNSRNIFCLSVRTLSPPKELELLPLKLAWRKPMGMHKLFAMLHNSLASIVNIFLVELIAGTVL